MKKKQLRHFPWAPVYLRFCLPMQSGIGLTPGWGLRSHAYVKTKQNKTQNRNSIETAQPLDFKMVHSKKSFKKRIKKLRCDQSTEVGSPLSHLPTTLAHYLRQYMGPSGILKHTCPSFFFLLRRPDLHQCCPKD